MSVTTKHSVLFVCLGKKLNNLINAPIFEMLQHQLIHIYKGNICRSPMGEAIFHDLATKRGVREQVNLFIILYH